MECLHGGVKLTESILRQKYWVPQCRRTIKTIIKNCADCVHVNPKPMTQYMGNLPTARVTAFKKPFTDSAVDYTGAIRVKVSNARGVQSNKAYIAIFVCMATKAIHIEPVCDLTADAYIAAFRRFVSRRGKIANLYSDNGTNFVRSNKILQENLEVIDGQYDATICNELARNGTTWHFSPAGGPHFNGLAEAAVKSVKLHIKKTIADSKLTFEELYTLLTQIEACVNSRPLCPLSSDPNDVATITPAHFLVGESLISPPEQSHLEARASWLTRWQKVQQMAQYFWKRWTADYLNELQMRTKWAGAGDAPVVNDLVLIKDENLPPTQWSTGRIVATFPGEDGLTRVVRVKTKDGEYKRPITKICALPEKYENIPMYDDKEEHIKSNFGRVASRKNSFGILPVITALLVMCANITSQSPITKPYSISKFDTSPGIYFEKTHDVYMTHSNWNMLAYLDLRTLHDKFRSLETNLAAAKEFCFRRASHSGGCRNIISHLKMKLEHINEKNSLIFEQKREKRSIPTLHCVGDIFGDLFGTLGSRFEQEYDHDLSKLIKNDEHLLLLMKNHTSILETTLNLVKNDEANLQKQNDHLNSLTESFKNFSNAIVF